MTGEMERELREGLEGVTDSYRVSEDGRVFSFKSNWRGLGERELVQVPDDHGYPSVRVTVDGKRRHLAVHRLVAFVHLPPRPSSSHEVRHLDGSKINNHANNLAWGTRSENALDRQRHGTEKGPSNAARTIDGRKGELCATSKLKNTDARVIQARFHGGETAASIAADYPHVSYETVNNAARRKTFKEIV